MAFDIFMSRINVMAPLLDLNCHDYLNIYEVGSKKYSGTEEWDCFCAIISRHFSHRTYHHREFNCPLDTIAVLEKALKYEKFKIVNVDFSIREGFFDQIRFSHPSPIEDSRSYIPQSYTLNDPMPDHYLVKKEYYLHWFVKRGYSRCAILILQKRPVICTFGYAPTWVDRHVGKSVFNLVLEQESFANREKEDLVKLINIAMADSCLELSDTHL